MCRCSVTTLLAAAAVGLWVQVLLLGVQLGSLAAAWQAWAIILALTAAPPAAALSCSLPAWRRRPDDPAAALLRGAAILLLGTVMSGYCLASVAAPF
jgi:hypothetical protein